MTKDELIEELGNLAIRFSEGWHEGIKIDASDIMLFNQIAVALAQPEQDRAYTYASSLAKTIWQKHYMKESPKFALLDTTEGVLTQIDNMTCGLVRKKPAQPEQEPVAFETLLKWDDDDPIGEVVGFIEGSPYIMVKVHEGKQVSLDDDLYATPPQRTEQDGQCKRCTDGCPACDATKLQKESHDLL